MNEDQDFDSQYRINQSELDQADGPDEVFKHSWIHKAGLNLNNRIVIVTNYYQKHKRLKGLSLYFKIYFFKRINILEIHLFYLSNQYQTLKSELNEIDKILQGEKEKKVSLLSY